MPKYKYKAKSLQNKVISDLLDARDEQDLRKRLRDRELTLLQCSEIEEAFSTYRMRNDEVSQFSRQMASMLGSGITVVRGMEIIKDRDFKPALQAIFTRLHRDTQNGHTLSEAMRLQNRAFPELFVNMIASGEASGQLEKSMAKMAVHYEKEYRLNGKVKAAMTYPAILMVVTLLVVMAVFVLILPQFFKLFENIELPLITKIMLGISSFLQNDWYMVIIGALILVAFYRYLMTVHPIRLAVDRAKLRIPKLGKLLKIIYTARFSRTLSSLYSSGLSMLNALEISSTILGNKYIESQFSEVVKEVRNGEPLSEALSRVIGFDRKLSTTILIGEESGRLDSMLESAAESFDYEAEQATEQMVKLIEPVMIVVMAVIVGGVMLSVMGPVMTLYQNVGNL